MKKIALFTFLALFVFSGTALAFDLAGHWESYVWCNSSKHGPPTEISCANIEYVGQSDMFYTSDGYYPIQEECWGVIQGKKIYHACTDTVYHGKTRGKNKIVGTNYVISEQKTCYIETYRIPENGPCPSPDPK